MFVCVDMEGAEWSVSVRSMSPVGAGGPAPGALPAAGDDRPSTSGQVAPRAPGQDDSIPVNESIISLLLKLHSQLSGRLDAFSLEEPPPDEHAPRDGPYYIGRVLRQLAALEPACAAAIAHVRRTLWPHQRERQAEQRARERRERDERARRARDRQAQLVRDFQRRQQQFLAAMAAEGGDTAHMDWEEEVRRDCRPLRPIGIG